MRTSLNKLQEIEQYLIREGDIADRLVFEARTIVDVDLAGEVSLQKETYAVISQYGRRRLKAELDAVHQQLFTLSRYQSFREKILGLFK
ncbi:hypothetical protein HQ865_04940 [Mucilaginibacter mali]|uniref:Uncharacterized protein n=1 Tax=Mucilaginibacter mali TaxID=2740462 RepID=A0A7D4PZR1_9SPHI|nr:hypothetical protein [Mucilaginibacter mali]QKJ29126.1 hypothetical protein HQ865_04940 [Mucilaginibacter mali]